ncbi:hypothetical protein [Pseudolabrys sp.]|uniref:hypothetical protein n=1 Tax=Pseudolabrys sp. TaxID=1960880 RepID=UPI003D144568
MSLSPMSLKRLHAVLILAATLVAALPARAAELVLFENAYCPWCTTFHHEIGAIYPKTDEGKRAPLRRVDTDKPIPPDLAFIERERLTPLFVLIDRGREIGRIRGYPGEDHFWGLLGVLLKKLDDGKSGSALEHDAGQRLRQPAQTAL